MNKSPRFFLPVSSQLAFWVSWRVSNLIFKMASIAVILDFKYGTILTIFDLQVTPILPTKFQVKQPFGSGEEVQTDSQDGGHLEFWIRTSLVIFDLQVSPILPTKLWELAQGWIRSCHLKQIVDNWHWLITIAHLDHFMLRWANNAVNNNQRVGAW